VKQKEHLRARQIVLFLLREKRKAWTRAKQARRKWGSTSEIADAYYDEYNVTHNLTECARRILYNGEIW
jgi:hypothetical protein